MSRKLVLSVLISYLIVTPLVSRNSSCQFLSNKEGSINQSEGVHNLDTGLNYTTIQEAIDALETLDGHTIRVDTGSYNESVLVYKALMLVGEDAKTTIINPEDATPFTVYITTENVTVTGFTLRGGDEAGVRIVSNHNIIYNNIIELSKGNGIELYQYDYPKYNIIFNNTVIKNGWNGILLGGSYNKLFNNFITNNTLQKLEGTCGLKIILGSNSKIENNTISNEEWGIRMIRSSNNTLKNNTMYSNKFNFGVDGNKLSHFLHDVDLSNRIEGKPIFYLINQSDSAIDPIFCHEEVAYLGVVNSENITIRNIPLTHNFQGLLIAYTNSSVVENVNTLYNSYGIALIESHGNILRNCTIAQNGEKWCSIGGDGIFLSGSDENVIENSIISSNGQCGIALGKSKFNIIRGNKISSNYFCGIQLFTGAVKNIIENNRIYDNMDGILLTQVGGKYVTNNTIRGNMLVNNYYGIELDSSDNNIFYHNNFKNNTVHIRFPFVYTPHNTWDNGVEGNYWDNYVTEQDLNNDGINDNAYSIAKNNIDRYPLLGMFSRFDTSPGYYVNVISNSTIEDYEYYEHNSTIKMHVSNMTANQTFGFCRICIPHALMTEPYNVTIDGAVPIYWNYTLYDDGDKRWIYFSYQHSILEIVIVPEFPSFLILPLFMVATLVTVILHRRKRIT